MFAVIQSGGKQYRVAPGEVHRVELLRGVSEPGQEVVFNEVCLLSDGQGVRIGAPLVAGARVRATLVAEGKADKVMVFRKKRREHFRRTRGHRQRFAEVKIEEILS